MGYSESLLYTSNEWWGLWGAMTGRGQSPSNFWTGQALHCHSVASVPLTVANILWYSIP